MPTPRGTAAADPIGRTGSSPGSPAGPVTARRLRPPSWRDPRLVVGLVLVGGSLALGTGVVSAAERTVGVYALSTPVGAGGALTQADLRIVQVRLDAVTAGHYLPVGTALPPAAVALRSLSAGELLPRAALGDPADLTSRAVSLPLTGPVPAGVVVGGQVDVWVAAAPTSLTSGAATSSASTGSTTVAAVPVPDQLLAGADVLAVSQDSGSLASTGATVQVLVPETQLPAVLGALTSDARIELVPVPGGVS